MNETTETLDPTKSVLNRINFSQLYLALIFTSLLFAVVRMG